jgi:hypothetical protein
MGCPIRMAGIGWIFYLVSFRKVSSGRQKGVYVQKYFDFFYELGHRVCIPPCYIVCVDYFTILLNTVVRILMSALICSAC